MSNSEHNSLDSTILRLDLLDARARTIFQRLVNTYIATGEPVGSRTISNQLTPSLSAATVRNVMQDLEEMGLLCSPHTSSGRIPTEPGLRLFVDTMLQVNQPSSEEQNAIVGELSRNSHGGTRLEDVFATTSRVISGISQCAGLVLAPSQPSPIKHIEFVRIETDRALVVLVAVDGQIENRVIEIPAGLPEYALQDAASWINANLRGLTLAEVSLKIKDSLEQIQSEANELTQSVVASGMAAWSGEGDVSARNLIVRGRANLIDADDGESNLNRIRNLLDDMESKLCLIDILEMVENGEGIKIFIGSESNRVSLHGSAIVAAPFRAGNDNTVGVLAVIGPKRMNYAKIVPVVDFSAQAMTKIIREKLNISRPQLKTPE